MKAGTNHIDLATKIRVMKGKMLTREDYDNMMIKHSVRDVALYLKNNTYYGKDLVELDENDVHRGRLEILLYRAAVRDALKIAKYLKGNEKKIYRYVYRKLEVEDIKKMLRTLEMGKPLSGIDRYTLFVSRASKIDFNKSLEANTIRELVRSLEGTNFYPILNRLVDQNGDINIFTAEMALDDYYYTQTIKQVRKMASGIDEKLLEQIFGLEIDFKNIFWILRAKKYYKIPKEMIYRFIIPYFYKVKKVKLVEMIEAPTLDQLYDLIEKTYYSRYIDFTAEKVEYQFLNFLQKVQLRNMREESYSISPVIGYMYMKQLEVQNITNIIEGIRYGMDREHIEKYLAGVS